MDAFIFSFLLVMFLCGLARYGWILYVAHRWPHPLPPISLGEAVKCWNCEDHPAAQAGLCAACSVKLEKMLRRAAR